MNVRREPGKPPAPGSRRQATPSGRGRAAGLASRPTGPGGRSWAFWRQMMSLALFGILLVAGLALVAVSSTGLVPALVFGLIIVALVVSVAITRAAR